MPRNHTDWLQAYIDYASHSEAPRYMHFWSGVSAIAGALRRKVWIDLGYFQWHPNFYIIFVAPPGIVSKSTTTGISMNLLRQVPGINFGPDVVTWQALVSCFAEGAEAFEFDGKVHSMAALTLESSEFGNLLDPQDRKMVDLLVHLWDGKQGSFSKATKHSGSDNVENPWINIIACTTPSWVAGNFPEYMIGGGFTSRCVFVYADKKEKLVAYPNLAMKFNREEEERKLLEDLISISNLVGEYKLTPAAYKWGEAWYESHYRNKKMHLDDSRFGGYIARKQSHIHKLAMVLAAATSDQLAITDEHLALADSMVSDLEQDFAKVFSRIGKSDTSVHVDRLLEYIEKRGRTPYQELYHFVHSHFPKARDFEDVVAGCVKSGKLRLIREGSNIFVEPGNEAGG